MGTVVVQAFCTLDGVVQGPGRPDEDPSGGFAHGGWQAGFPIGDLVAQWEAGTEALLLGRRTYEIFAGTWGVWDEAADGLMGELTRRYNRVPKVVATRTAAELGWRNSRALGPDLAAEVGALRDRTDGEVRVWGSTGLVRGLADLDLVDEYRLVWYPLVLGSGKRLFGEGFPTSRLELVDARPLPSGVVVSTYRRRAGR